MMSGQLDQAPDILTVPEAASLLRVGKGSVYESCRRGELPSVRIGRRLLIPKAALMRLLAEGNSNARKEE
jgi:excisionase family DNA binding protein